jgi:N-acetylneuraminic acid mutarotase
MLLFGGEHCDGKTTRFFNDLYRLELRKDGRSLSWRQVRSAVAPAPRSAHQAVVTGSQQMFLFGGEFGSSRETRFHHHRDFWMLDLRTHAWTELTCTDPSTRGRSATALPSPRSGHRMALWKHVIALFGGFQDSAGAEMPRYLDDLWLFDTREHRWLRADWLNDPNCRPSARSGFQFVAIESVGILLYGGYCQMRNAQRNIEGRALSDMWLLRIDPVDLRKTRWERRKLLSGPSVPQPRSGASAVAVATRGTMLLFGGVVDESEGDELLHGTCLNDLWEYSLERNSWRLLRANSPPLPRYNAAISLLSNRLLLLGGIHERGDRQASLDDAHVLNIDRVDAEGWRCVRPLSADVSWADDEEGSESEEGSDSDSEGDSESCETDGDSDSDSDSEDTDYTEDHGSDSDSHALPPAPSSSSPHPQPLPGQTLKSYASMHAEHFTEQVRLARPELTGAKELRGEAFLLAQLAFNDFALERLRM